MKDRFCPTCNRFKNVESFPLLGFGLRARDCFACHEKRVQRASALAVAPAPVMATVPQRHYAMRPSREFPGVDIDRIHRKLGAVRK